MSGDKVEGERVQLDGDRGAGGSYGMGDMEAGGLDVLDRGGGWAKDRMISSEASGMSGEVAVVSVEGDKENIAPMEVVGRAERVGEGEKGGRHRKVN